MPRALYVRRPVILDGGNVGCRHGALLAKRGVGDVSFSWEGLLLARDYFVSRKFSVKIVLPDTRTKNQQSSHKSYLRHELQSDIIYVPGHEYDDTHIITFAKRNGGVIITNDRYSDVFNQLPHLQIPIMERMGFKFRHDGQFATDDSDIRFFILREAAPTCYNWRVEPVDFVDRRKAVTESDKLRQASKEQNQLAALRRLHGLALQQQLMQQRALDE